MLGLGSALTTSSTKEQLYSLGELDGTDDYLHLGVVPGVKGLRDMTVSAWVKTNEASLGNFDRIVSCDGGTGNAIWRLFVSSDSGNKGVIWNCFNGDGDSIGLLTTSDVWGTGGNDDKWVHVVARIDASASPKTSMFINGGTPTTSTANQSDEDMRNEAATQLSIGAQGNGGNYWFPGFIDDVAIWNVPLSNNAVDAVYNGGKPFDLNNNRGDYSNSSALVGYWRMGNGTNDDKANGVVFDQTASTIGSNIVPESSFEAVTTWTAVTASGSTSALDTSFSHSGSNSWKLVVDGTDENLGVISDAITVEANTAYKISWWSYVPSANNSKYVQVSGTSSGDDWHRLGDTQNHNGETIPGDVWTQSTFYFVTAGGTDLQIKLTNGAASGNNGDVRYFDDIELVKIGGNPGITAADATFSADTPDD